METKGKITFLKAKAFRLGQTDWYNVNDSAMEDFKKLKKDDEVVIEYEKKGTFRNVSKVSKAGAEEPAETTSEGTGKCTVCGKELKNPNYKTCWGCKDKASKGNTQKSSTNYSEDRTAQIQRGNALNAASMVASGENFGDPEAAQQYTLILAEAFLTWLRAE